MYWNSNTPHFQTLDESVFRSDMGIMVRWRLVTGSLGDIQEGKKTPWNALLTYPYEWAINGVCSLAPSYPSSSS